MTRQTQFARPLKGGGKAGFAAVDALVALAIFATTIALVLRCVDTARHIALAAAETRRANVLGQYLLESSPKAAGSWAGRSDGFVWRINVTNSTVDNQPQIRLCRQSVGLRAAGSGRRYGLATTQICPPPSAP